MARFRVHFIYDSHINGRDGEHASVEVVANNPKEAREQVMKFYENARISKVKSLDGKSKGSK